MNSPPLRETPLAGLHRSLGARMVPFAGYAMPVQYPAGIIAEHTHTRTHASLFDVSHMGQGRLDAPPGGAGEAETVAATALERLVPGDIRGLRPGRIRYTLLTSHRGGILDDLMVTHAGDHLFLIVNAATKAADFAHIEATLGESVRLTQLADHALLALQGPQAAAVLRRLVTPGTGDAVATMGFMTARGIEVDGIPCRASRSGYTGEDGFELSVAADRAEALARRLLAEPEVAPAGLGARDSLRLEAGLCLYGADISPETNPIEAGLAWVIGKRRRDAADFPGAGFILRELARGSGRRRVGLVLKDRIPARAHAAITDPAGRVVGEVTSGGFAPTLGAPVAMGYVDAACATVGTGLGVVVRDVSRAAEVVALPFVPHRYYRGET